MNILDYITIILFSIGVLITGVSFSKTGKDMKSFFSQVAATYRGE